MKTTKDIVWDNLKCEEVAFAVGTQTFNCGRPAEVIVFHNGDRRAWAMCLMCADHNIRNRGGIELVRKDGDNEKKEKLKKQD